MRQKRKKEEIREKNSVCNISRSYIFNLIFVLITSIVIKAQGFAPVRKKKWILVHITRQGLVKYVRRSNLRSSYMNFDQIFFLAGASPCD